MRRANPEAFARGEKSRQLAGEHQTPRPPDPQIATYELLYLLDSAESQQATITSEVAQSMIVNEAYLATKDFSVRFDGETVC